MLERGDHAARVHMRIGEHLVDRVDRSGRHAALITALQERSAIEAGDRLCQSAHHLYTSRDPIGIQRKRRIRSPVGQLEQLTQRLPVLIAAGDVQPLAVARLE